MIFLLQYDPKQEKILQLLEYTAEDLAKAQATRLEMELDSYRHHLGHEVVMLEAKDKAAIRRSHAHYFGIQALRDLVAEMEPVPTGT